MTLLPKPPYDLTLSPSLEPFGRDVFRCDFSFVRQLCSDLTVDMHI
jgi:hypothetical protein